MEICRIDPLSDIGWKEFVQDHPNASIFHTPEWLAALQRTYEYEPVVYAGVDSTRKILCGIPFCRVNSFLTGDRLVSLPFSDHCQPLVESEAQLSPLLEAARSDLDKHHLKYVEIRPTHYQESRLCEAGLSRSAAVMLHTLDLLPAEDDLSKRFHAKGVRQPIARSEREHLQHWEGQSEELLTEFYRLLLLTRRRHQLPPQPIAWFRNAIECLGCKLKIHVASKDGIAIAGILTLWFRNTVTYKYSCSDPQFNSLNGTVFLLWRAIKAAKSAGATLFDFGRSDYSTPGLITFKDHWGAVRQPLNYYRYPEPELEQKRSSRLIAAGKRLLAFTPDPMFRAIGGLLYRHAG
jgi:CelD/BcsL family acetyltransferase involved in cellulose biosynthesis